ncbi:signal peptide [Acinetobacter baumannii]|jgi:hypothetical protein|uniref:Uncharacterized protein n=1 Tax=Acinetobacter baumannii TaxID=470 RepID=A0A1E3M997_ACIBA|nr:hypothetical protein [Acinetobacter baumannii]ABS90301.2 hypothetical protein A1S_3876 [Acinetobacter baumannii ATCC 17978]AKQ25608.1 hypothetical protein ACX60_02265 [Acinetobacter baumannii]APP30060.1 hypothetical protein AUO97_04235 [Acinetobacter baumannii]APX48529.1 hypothetical protein AT570_04235 [Acinetobacter baumannii]EHT1074312.1 hypothetical protein [Acinetobacter baumannii]
MPLQRKQNSKLLWILIGGLSILVVLFFAAQWFFKKTEISAPMVDPQPASVPAPEKTTNPSESSEPVVQTQTANSQQLVNEDVLKQPIPAQESLAKEEVSKLNDIHRQLQDQEATLKAQHADADQLIKLKEEQVKLLEAQVKQQ